MGRDGHLKRSYGITQAQYEEMLAEQGGGCAICGTDVFGDNQHGSMSAAVDHDHDTGVVRGLLCRECNTTLGRMKDNPELLRRAADYIEMESAITKHRVLGDTMPSPGYRINPIEVTLWLRGDSEQNAELAKAAGLSEVAIDYFAGALHEVRVVCIVDPQTGHYAVKRYEEL